MTYNNKLLILLKTIDPKYLGPIAADFAEDVLHIHEAYNEDSSALKNAIAVARANDVDAASAAASAAYAAFAAASAAGAAAGAAYAAFAAAAANAAYAATYAYLAAEKYGDKDIKQRQYNILKKWSDKGVIDKVILALYEV